MNNVWWTFVTFLRKLFVPPKYTTLEEELIRQVSHLEGELHRAREKYNELTERMLFPPAGPNVPTESVNFSIPTAIPPVRERRKQLEELSKARAHQEYLARADKLVAEAEERMRNRGEEESTESSPH